MRLTTAGAVVLAALAAGPAAAQTGSGDAQQVATAHQTDFQIGQLATIRAHSARVRQFGRELMDDHGAALEQLARDGRVQWPIDIDASHRQLEQELSTLDGRAFDRRFVSAMVDDHQALASLLRGQSEPTSTARSAAGAPDAVGTSGTSASTADTPRATGTSGARGAAHASSTLRSVEKHLAEAKRLQRSLGGSGR